MPRRGDYLLQGTGLHNCGTGKVSMKPVQQVSGEGPPGTLRHEAACSPEFQLLQGNLSSVLKAFSVIESDISRLSSLPKINCL